MTILKGWETNPRVPEEVKEALRVFTEEERESLNAFLIDAEFAGVGFVSEEGLFTQYADTVRANATLVLENFIRSTHEFNSDSRSRRSIWNPGSSSKRAGFSSAYGWRYFEPTYESKRNSDKPLQRPLHADINVDASEIERQLKEYLDNLARKGHE